MGTHQIPFAKISTPAMINLTKFFPKQFHRKFFPRTLTKNFSAKRNDHPVCDFPKKPHRTFRPIPASKPHLTQPTLNPISYQPAPYLNLLSQRLVDRIAGRCDGV